MGKFTLILSKRKLTKILHSNSVLSLIMILTFILTTSFGLLVDENKMSGTVISDNCKNVSDTDQACELVVDILGGDTISCEEGAVTLLANVSGESNCSNSCSVFTLEDTSLCGNNKNYVVWLTNGNSSRWFSNIDLEWEEFEDGTATIKGTVFDDTLTMETYEVDATYSGRTTTPPEDSPKDHQCNDENPDEWVYYTELTGSITQSDGSWSVDLTRMGPAFQLGNGANISEREAGKYGGSGWFNTTDSEYDRGDFNINMEPCDNQQRSGVSYLWSTGETTQFITVTEPGTYSVTVKDCENCEVTEEFVVTGDAIVADAGEDQTICSGNVATRSNNQEEATLIATGGDEYLWSTGETTPEIIVSPDETTTYTVTVSKDGCSDMDEVVVVVENCNTLKIRNLYPVPAVSNSKLSIDIGTNFDKSVTISLYNLDGHMTIPEFSIDLTKKGSNTIDLDLGSKTKLAPGMYLVKVKGANNSVTRRVLIK